MEDYEVVESTSNSNVLYRKPKVMDNKGAIHSVSSAPVIAITNGSEKRSTEKPISASRSVRDFLNLDISKARNNSDLDSDSKNKKMRNTSTPEPPLMNTLQIPSQKKCKAKGKNTTGQVCAAEIGPAVGLGVNIGTTIVSNNGINGSQESPLANTPSSSRRSSPAGQDSFSDQDFSDSDYEDYVEEAKEGDVLTCPVNHDQGGKETVNTIIPCNIDQLFTMMFTKSKFYLDFHTSRKTFDIVQSEWEKSGDGAQKSRIVTFTVTLANLMGPKHCYVTETQTLHRASTPGVMYAVDSETLNAGVPYADSFYVTTHFCLSKESANESRLIIVNQLKFKKSVWGVKNFIEKNSWEGINDFYCNLARALKEECSKSDFIGDSVKRTGDSNGRKRRVNKAPAPMAPELQCNGGPDNLSMPCSGGSYSKSSQIADNSLVLKILLSVLAGLLLLNGFLFLKMGSLESIANSPAVLFSQPLVLPAEIPQSHQQWLMLLQHQESLHKQELMKWHDILSAALHILNQAESGLESLKAHIATSYPPERKTTEKLILKSGPENIHIISAGSTQFENSTTVVPIKPAVKGKASA